jgi:hypothetical protein
MNDRDLEGYALGDPKRVPDQSFEPSRIYDALMNDEPIPWSEKLTDPKPIARVKADQNEWVKLRAEKLGPCRICTLGDNVTLHHLVSKSLRGDDVAANLVPLCGDGTRGCHGRIESRDPWAATLLGHSLTRAEREYVIEKKSAAFLNKYYGVAA